MLHGAGLRYRYSHNVAQVLERHWQARTDDSDDSQLLVNEHLMYSKALAAGSFYPEDVN